jgi:hypothetical protein
VITDFAGIVERFATPGVRLRRYRAQTLSSTTGRFDDPTYSDTYITACVQRPNGRQLRQLPENQRHEEVIRVDTSTELRTANPAKATQADQILYNHDTYEVQKVIDYAAHANYYSVLAVKVLG